VEERPNDRPADPHRSALSGSTRQWQWRLCRRAAGHRAGGSGIEVTLRAPPPLDKELHIVVRVDGAELRDGELVVATARRAQVDIAVPPPPSLALAREAERHYAGFDHHPFPDCFVCGPDREAGDGLRIFAGAIPGESGVAAVWLPDTSLSEGDGAVSIEHVWAALDCAGYFAVRARAGVAVLGRIAVEVVRRPAVGEAVVVTGWAIESEGRKHRVGTALHDGDGALCAKALATWVTIG
jgi:hypothetical protein